MKIVFEFSDARVDGLGLVVELEDLVVVEVGVDVVADFAGER